MTRANLSVRGYAGRHPNDGGVWPSLIPLELFIIQLDDLWRPWDLGLGDVWPTGGEWRWVGGSLTTPAAPRQTNRTSRQGGARASGWGGVVPTVRSRGCASYFTDRFLYILLTIPNIQVLILIMYNKKNPSHDLAGNSFNTRSLVAFEQNRDTAEDVQFYFHSFMEGMTRLVWCV